MFTNSQISSALNAYGTTSETHLARLASLADMLTVEAVTLDDIVLAIRHAAACDSLGESRDKSNAKIDRAVERISGYSAATFGRYSIVLSWLEPAVADNSTMIELLGSGDFTGDAISALVQLAAGKVGSRKLVSDAIATAIAKRDSAALVAVYRRLLAATKAKAKAKAERKESAKATEESLSDSVEAPSTKPERTPAEILADLSIADMADLLMSRIAAEAETLTDDDNERIADALASIEAMIHA